jgi:putative glutamine amidotransferase
MPAPIIGITSLPSPAGSEPEEARVVQAAYARAVAAASGLPVLISPDLDEQTLHQLLDRLDGLLLSGGGDIDPARYGAAPRAAPRGFDEARDRTEVHLARWAIEAGVPVLGICRGAQVLNVAQGGTLIQDIASECPGAVDHDGRKRRPDTIAHRARLQSDSLLAGVAGDDDLEVNSAHHQAVLALAPSWRAVAWAEDGIIEALELHDHPFALGVQWHPERLPRRPEAQAIFSGLTRAARRERS